MSRPAAQDAGPTPRHPGIARFCVGLTGGIGCGKSTVASSFAELGAAVVDTDAIAHQLTAPHGAAMAAIAAQFGADFITADGALDRARMRAHVFGDGSEAQRAAGAGRKTQLEAILHPLIRSETVRIAAATDGAYVMLVVPLLLESSIWQVDRILAIDCSEALQIERVMARSGLSAGQVQAIMAHQVSRAERRARADDIIENNGNLAALLPQIAQLHDLYLEFAKAR